MRIGVPLRLCDGLRETIHGLGSNSRPEPAIPCNGSTRGSIGAQPNIQQSQVVRQSVTDGRKGCSERHSLKSDSLESIFDELVRERNPDFYECIDGKLAKVSN